MHKTHKDIHISDPRQITQAVCACPDQSIFLRIDYEWFPDHKIEFARDNLYLYLAEEQSSYVIYELRFTAEAKEASEYSNFLADYIFIFSKDSSIELPIILKTENKHKSNFFKVINPFDEKITLTPGDILEIVLQNVSPNFLSHSWSFTPSNDISLDVDFLGEQLIEANRDNHAVSTFPNLPYAVYVHDKNINQKHFWFRFQKNLLNLVNEHKETLYVGEINLTPSIRDRSVLRRIEIYLNFSASSNENLKASVFNSLLLPRLDLTQKKQDEKIKCTKTPSSGFVFATHASKKDCSSKKNIYVVSVQLLDTKSLEEGCVICSGDKDVVDPNRWDRSKNCKYNF